MTRVEILRELRHDGRRFTASQLEECRGELDLPLAGVLVVAGHAVPGRLLPPDNRGLGLREFSVRRALAEHHQGACSAEPGIGWLAAVHCTTDQVVRAARMADRLSARTEDGAWQPVSYGVDQCPDAGTTTPEPGIT